MIQTYRHWLQSDIAVGVLLMLAAILAMLAANSPLSSWYAILLDTPIEIRFGALQIAKPLLLWVNDGLMALFFLLVGLELKREILFGELAQPSKVVLPVAAALGGIVVPALIYVAMNQGNPDAMRGWAIPTATDIAFALGVLSLLGKRVPFSLKLFLLTLAIVDDMGAIAIIAVFYTDNLSLVSLLISGAAMLVLLVMNWRNVSTLTPYLLVGLIMWIAVLKSGVHATLAGVLLAFFIPSSKPEGAKYSLGEGLEHDLHGSVYRLILPLFAFVNTGIPLAGLTLDSLINPVPLGIALGLFVGKQVGVFGFSWLLVQLRLAKLPEGMGWWELYGVAVLAGIGFTMSLFISSLAFTESNTATLVDDRLGILLGSLFSGLVGYALLHWRLASKVA